MAVTWNPLDKGPSVTLSNGNMTAASDDYDSVRATLSQSTRLRYLEVTIGATPSQCLVGIMTSVGDLTSYVGSDIYGWGYLSTAAKITGGGGPGSGSGSYGAGYGNGNIISLLYNAVTGALGFWKDGADQGVAFTGIFGDLYPAFSSDGGAGNSFGTANFGATPFTYSPPPGYVSWDFVPRGQLLALF